MAITNIVPKYYTIALANHIVSKAELYFVGNECVTTLRRSCYNKKYNTKKKSDVFEPISMAILYFWDTYTTFLESHRYIFYDLNIIYIKQSIAYL